MTDKYLSEDIAPDFLPSKSQRKRDASALQALGEQLVKLSNAQLRHVPLGAELLAAVQQAQTITQRGGHKRQLQYIGKLMRQLDQLDIAAISAAIANLHIKQR